MSIEDELARVADASERTADALEKILSLLESGAPTPLAVRFFLPRGVRLNREGTVSNVYGEFNAPVGRIDLNRLQAGPNVVGRVWSALLGRLYTFGDEFETIEVRTIEVFVKEDRGVDAKQFGPTCQKLVGDWYAQLYRLLG